MSDEGPGRARMRVTVELVDAGSADDAPPVTRLKQLLKECLRRWAFRCARASLDSPPPVSGRPGTPEGR